uniref:Uncharacterized protein n=1 Tax=Rhizophora mucronata TaxID=61149 RepID=A0A2P2MDH9_RHIMU
MGYTSQSPSHVMEHGLDQFPFCLLQF